MPGLSGELIASAPLIMGAIRLARFNTELVEGPPSYFIGLPTPMNALAIATLVLFILHIKTNNPEYSQPRLLLPVFLSLSFLMISKIRYPKFPILNFRSGLQNTYRLLGIAIFGICFVLAIFLGKPYKIMALFISYYILSGLFIHIIKLGNIELNNQGTKSNESKNLY